MPRILVPAILLACICCAPLSATAAGASLDLQREQVGRTEILWDAFGVPHIYGKDVPAVLRGYGYAQMENHAELLLELIATARGRAAEYFGAGPSNSNLSSDVTVRINGIPRTALRWYVTGGAEQRTFLDAFVSGINEYAASHRDTIAPRFLQVLPVTPPDILASYLNLIHYQFMAGQSNVFGLISAWQSGAAAVDDHAGALASAGNGSVGWALGRGRTNSGNAILMGNPHLPWGINQPRPGAGAMQLFEAQLVTDTLNAHGATFVSFPFISIGFNDDLGWTHTINDLKNVDLYELTLEDGGYLWEGRVLPLLHRQEQVRVRNPDGSLQVQTLDVLASIHGPIVAQRGDKALALRVAGLDAPSIVSQYWAMVRAHNLQEFSQAMSRMQLPFFNVIYADRDGDIMYVFAGLQPARNGGNYSDWQRILPGDRASTFWTRTLSWNALPKTIDPAGGFVQNCNDPPWTSTFPQEILPQRYPAYIAPQTMSVRAQQSARFLLSQPQFTVDDLLMGKMSTHMELSARLVPDLVAAAKASGNPTAIAAAEVLQAWDGMSDADSRGAALFEQWYRAYASDPNTPKSKTFSADGGIYPPFKIDWSAQQPLTTPRGLADPASAVPALLAAAGLLQQQFGRLDIPWGDLHRAVLVTWAPDFASSRELVNQPVSGSDTVYGGTRIVQSLPDPQGGFQLDAIGGDSYVQLVEFTPQGPRAQTLLAYGNASRPGSAHIADQLQFFADKRLRPAARTRLEVEAQTLRREYP